MALRHLVNYSSVNVRIGSVGVFIGGGGEMWSVYAVL